MPDDADVVLGGRFGALAEMSAMNPAAEHHLIQHRCPKPAVDGAKVPIHELAGLPVRREAAGSHEGRTTDNHRAGAVEGMRALAAGQSIAFIRHEIGRIELFGMPEDHVESHVRVQGRTCASQPAGWPEIVRIEKREELAACQRDAVIASRARTLTRLTRDADASGIALEDVSGAIVRSVVDDDHLEGRVLREHAVDGVRHVADSVEGRDDDTDIGISAQGILAKIISHLPEFVPMNAAVRFRSNSPNVVHEIFDDEVVVVNLDTGRYFSLRESSAAVWNMAITGATIEEMAAWFTSFHTTPAPAIEQAVNELVNTLLEQHLLVPSHDAHTFVAPSATPARIDGPFMLPPLQVFTDMQDLLLLDPIHEVDEGGWPLAKPQSDTGR